MATSAGQKKHFDMVVGNTLRMHFKASGEKKQTLPTLARPGSAQIKNINAYARRTVNSEGGAGPCLKIIVYRTGEDTAGVQSPEGRAAFTSNPYKFAKTLLKEEKSA